MKYNLIALACAILLAAGLSLTVVAGPTEPDTDSDGIVDIHDDCTVVANSLQQDSDQDGYGNMCDSDFQNDGKVNVIDFATFKAAFLVYDEQVDYQCDGKVNVIDFATFKAHFSAGTPGPTGQTCAGAKGNCTGNPGC